MMEWMKFLPFAKTNVVELKDNNINEFTIDPKDLELILLIEII